MINREWQQVKVITFSDEVDDYGQKRQGERTYRYVDMVCKLYSQTNVEDPRYVDIEMLGLTKDTSISDKNQIEIGGVTYNVKYIIPTGRLTQVLMYKA